MNTTLVTDPFDSEMVGLKFPKVDAEIVSISHQHKDHSAVKRVSGVRKVIEGPGEYEVAGISFVGIKTFHDDKKGTERGENTIYLIEAEGLRLVHLGDLGHTLNDTILEEIGEVDILMVPVGGFYTIGPKEAVEIVGQIEPAIVIPMHYRSEGMNKDLSEKLVPLTDFISQSGLKSEELQKISIKKANITPETKIITLERKTN